MNLFALIGAFGLSFGLHAHAEQPQSLNEILENAQPMAENEQAPEQQPAKPAQKLGTAKLHFMKIERKADERRGGIGAIKEIKTNDQSDPAQEENPTQKQ